MAPSRSARGAVDLPLLQRYLNFWFSSSLISSDRVSSNAATDLRQRIKGRPDETTQYRTTSAPIRASRSKLGRQRRVRGPADAQRHERSAARRYIRDCEIGLKALEHGRSSAPVTTSS